MTKDPTTQTSQESVSETLLLVDDNPTNLQVLAKILEPLGYTLLFARSGERAMTVLQNIRPALLLLDVMMPGIDGFEVCYKLKQNEMTRSCGVIFLSALSDVESKVRGFEVGGADFITKPFQAEEVIARVQTHIKLYQLQQQLVLKNDALQHELSVAEYLLQESEKRSAGPLLGESLQVRALHQSIDHAASTNIPLLMTGSVGADFEAVARTIHNRSPRRNRPFIRINAQVLVGQDGYSFSSSSDHSTENSSRGILTLAEHGTLFLEQLDALPLDMQKELVQTFGAFNEGEEAKHNVRLIAGTSKDLQTISAYSSWDPLLLTMFRSLQIVIPSLSQRKEDLPTLIDFYVKQFAQDLGKIVEGFSPESLKLLHDYHWPGDIRELQNIIEREVALASSTVVELDPSVLKEGHGVVLGGYQLLDKLGEGGMGEVWRAKHQWLKREAAVKLIRFQQGMPEESKQSVLQRFQKEAQVTAGLTSPYTVNLYDFGLDQSGVLFYAMELLTGVDLQDLIHKFGAIPAERVSTILQPICRSLAEAHREGLIHRDIKPSNIFLSRLGLEVDFPKLLDFGVVKDTQIKGITQNQPAGHVCGTPGYMAPEQIEGIDVTPVTDVYAIGCVMFWCLTGRTVFEADNPVTLIMRHVSEKPAPPSRFTKAPIPPEMDALVLACLAIEPDKRPGIMEVYDTLKAISWTTPWTQNRAMAWWHEHHAELDSKKELDSIYKGEPTVLARGKLNQPESS